MIFLSLKSILKNSLLIFFASILVSFLSLFFLTRFFWFSNFYFYSFFILKFLVIMLLGYKFAKKYGEINFKDKLKLALISEFILTLPIFIVGAFYVVFAFPLSSLSAKFTPAFPGITNALNFLTLNIFLDILIIYLGLFLGEKFYNKFHIYFKKLFIKLSDFFKNYEKIENLSNKVILSLGFAIGLLISFLLKLIKTNFLFFIIPLIIITLFLGYFISQKYKKQLSNKLRLKISIIAVLTLYIILFLKFLYRYFFYNYSLKTGFFANFDLPTIIFSMLFFNLFLGLILCSFIYSGIYLGEKLYFYFNGKK